MNKKMSKTALYKVLIGVVGVKSLLQELQNAERSSGSGCCVALKQKRTCRSGRGRGEEVELEEPCGSSGEALLASRRWFQDLPVISSGRALPTSKHTTSGRHLAVKNDLTSQPRSEANRAHLRLQKNVPLIQDAVQLLQFTEECSSLLQLQFEPTRNQRRPQYIQWGCGNLEYQCFQKPLCCVLTC